MVDIVDTVFAAGSFKTLVTAVKTAGLSETLKSKGPLTVFEPTDDAFVKSPKGTFADLHSLFVEYAKKNPDLEEVKKIEQKTTT
jgi:uncharacterized surface protein with fasciclin (FAS1) repeats